MVHILICENTLIVRGNQTGDSAAFYYTDYKSEFIVSNLAMI